MSLGKVLAVTILTAAATTVATFFALRALTGPGLSREVQVPEVGGLRLDEARSALASRGLLLVISDTTPDAKLEAGRVVRQSPQRGSSQRTGAEVRVVLSAGQPEVVVPSLLHLPLATASELLRGAGLTTGEITRREDDREAAGQVIASSPAPGQRAARGSAVGLVLSRGAPSAVKVPSLLGRSRAQATQLLEAAGLKLGRVTFGYDADRRAGVVIKQAPGAEAPASRGSVVNLVLNEGD